MFASAIKERFLFNKKNIFIRDINHIIAGKLYYLEYKDRSSDEEISKEIGIREDLYREIIKNKIKADELSITPNGEVYFKSKDSALKGADNLMDFLNKIIQYLK